MKKSCKIVYFDRSGKESKVYTDNLKYGEEIAKQKYLESMAGVVHAKFQKGDSTSAYIKIPEGDTKLISNLEKNYQKLGKGGISKKMEAIKGKRSMSETAEASIRKRLFNKFYEEPIITEDGGNEIEAALSTFKESTVNQARAKANQKVEEYFDKEESLKSLIEKELKKYDDKRKYGSVMHGIIERYVSFRTAYLEYNEDSSNKLDEHKQEALAQYAYTSFFNEYQEAKNSLEEGKEVNVSNLNDAAILPNIFLENGKNNRRDQSDFIKAIGTELTANQIDAHSKNIRNIEKFLVTFGQGATFMTEINIGDEQMGIRGIADLVVRKANGNLIPVDYKTKTKGYEESQVSTVEAFATTKYGTLGDKNKDGKFTAFDGLADSRKTDVSIQLSMLKAILEKNGFEGRVESPVAIVIVGEYKEALDPADPGSYVGFEFIPIELTALDREVKNYVKETTGFVMKEANEIGVESVISTLRELVDGPAGEWNSKESINQRISASIRSVTLVSPPGNEDSGTYVFRVGNSTIDTNLPNETPTNVVHEYIKNYYEDPNVLNNGEKSASSLIEFFEEKKLGNGHSSVKNRVDMISKYNAYLAGIDPEFYELKFLKQLDGFSDAEGSNIVVAIHKKTKALQLIEVSTMHNADFEFKNSKSTARNNLFGNFFKTKQIKAAYSFQGLQNDTYSAGMLRLALISAQLALNPNYGGIERLLVGNPTINIGSGDTMTAVPQDMINNLKILKDVVNGNEDTFTESSIKELLNNDKIYDIDIYKTNPLATWYNYIIAHDEVHRHDARDSDALVLLKKHYAETSDERGTSQIISQKTRDLLFNAIEQIKSTMSIDQFKTNTHTQLLSKAYLHLNRIVIDSVESIEIGAKHGLTTMQGSQNETIRGLQKAIVIAKQHRLSKGVKFLSAHQRLVMDLKKESGTFLNPIQAESTGMLDGLLIDPERAGEPENWMKFKPDSDLTGPQLKYKQFFIKNIKNVFFARKGVTAAEVDASWNKIVAEKSWDPDWIPTIPADSTNALQQAFDARDPKKAISNVFNSFGKQSKDLDSNKLYERPPSSISSKNFIGPFEHNKKRKNLFGITDESNRGTLTAETNIERILNYMVMKEAEESTNGELFVMSSAIHATMYMSKEFDHKENEPLLELINDVILMNVRNTVNQETNEAARATEKFVKGVATSALIMSPSLAMVEMMTAALGSVNSSLDNILRDMTGRVFQSTGLKSRYSNIALWKQAFKMMTFQEGDKGVALDRLFGISTSDANFLAEKMMVTRKGSMLNKQKWYEKMSMASKGMRRQMLVAHMITDKVYDAYIYNKDTDSVDYDPNKDERLFIEEVVGRAPVTDEEKKKAAFYKALRGELEREGFTTTGEDGVMTIDRAYTSMEINKIKEHADIQYGSLDGDEKIILEKHAVARAFLVLKKFIVPKIKVYWRGETSAYGGRTGGFIYDEELGEYVMDTTPEEGILQTLGKFTSLLNSLYGFQKNETLRNKDNVLKEFWNANRAGNMTKLMSDMTLMLIGYIATAAMFGDLDDEDEDDWRNSVLGKSVKSGMFNAVADYNFAASAYSLYTGDSLISMSIFSRFTKTMAGALFEMDPTQVLEALTVISGPVKAVKGVTEFAFE